MDTTLEMHIRASDAEMASDLEKEGICHAAQMVEIAPNLANLTLDAKHAADVERKMGFRRACQLYPKAILFSMGLSLAVVMEGYDTWLLGSLYGIPSFAKKFGSLTPGGTYLVAAHWQTALTNGTAAGQIFGLLINGIVSEKFGYRKTMIAALCALAAVLFMQFFSVDVRMLTAAYVFCGIPWGIFQTLTITYAAEVVPVTLRPYLTSYVNICWAMGQLLASGVLKGCLSLGGDWAWRAPYAIQWFWPIPILIVAFLAPESPWWLVRHGKMEEAKGVVERLLSEKDRNFDAEQTIKMMIYTNELEKKNATGTTYMDCFRGVDRKRTEITCVTWLVQNTCGAAMLGWAVYFMEQAGLSVDNAFSLGIGQTALAFVGNICACCLLPRVGRRTLYLWGQIAMFVTLLFIGGFGTPRLYEGSPWAWATGGILIVQFFIYAISIGPACYSLVGEMPSTRLRIKTVVLARSVYQLAGIVIGFLMPQFMNPERLNWRGKTAFFWAGTCFLGIVWTYFRLPEPNGLTYADLDALFEDRVPARRFGKVSMEAYSVDRLHT